MKGFNLFLVLPLFLFVFTGSAQTDQELAWSSYFGGNQLDYLFTVASIPEGGAIIGGYAASTTGISTPFAHQSFYGGGDADGVILKLSENNDLQWATYFGGSGDDLIYGVGILSDGSFVVVGTSNSISGIATQGAFIEDSPDVYMAFVSRFSAEGEQMWGTYLGGTVVEFPLTYASSVAVDENDNIIAGKDPDRTLLSGIFGSFSDAPNGFSEELKEVMVSVGGEYWYNDVFAARMGYFWEHRDKGDRKFFSLGLGFRYQVFGIDFAYLIPKNEHPLAETLRFSMVFNWEGANDRTVKE